MTTTKKFKIPLFAIITLLGSWAGVQGAEELENARVTLKQWVETRQIIAEERTEWMAEEKTLNESIDFMKAEIESLTSAIAVARDDISSQGDNEKKLSAEITEYEAAIAIVEKAVPVFEAKLIELSSVFPAVFIEKVATQMRRIPDPTLDRIVEIPLEERIQNVLSILRNVEYFNKTINLSSELREANGETVEVRTLYIGFGQAYFSDEAMTTAGYGYPVVGKGWEWIERPEIAQAVNDAILVADNRKPALFVSVPVSLQE